MTSDPSTVPDLWTTWTATPVLWLVVALATAAYLAGSIRADRWPAVRTVWWFAAMASLIVALDSGLATYAHHVLWAHMIVHLLMITVIPVFLVFAQPIRLSTQALHPRAAHRVERIMESTVIRFVTAPFVTVPLYSAVLVLTHLTGFQELLMQHMWLHAAEFALYLVSGYLLLLPLIGDELSGHHYTYPARFVALLVSMGADTLVGVTLMMTGYDVAPDMSASRADWGLHSAMNPSVTADQTAAGAIMWWAGDGLMMLLLVVVAWQWIRAESTRAPRPSTRGGGRPSFLEAARQSALGADTLDVDDDDAALAAYNRRLAAMHGRIPNQTGRGRRARVVHTGPRPDADRTGSDQ